MGENCTRISPRTSPGLRSLEDGRRSNNIIDQLVEAAHHHPLKSPASKSLIFNKDQAKKCMDRSNPFHTAYVDSEHVELSSTITETSPPTSPLHTTSPHTPPSPTPPPHTPPPRTPPLHTPPGFPRHTLPPHTLPPHSSYYHTLPLHFMPPHILAHNIPRPQRLPPLMPDSTRRDSRSNLQKGFSFARRLILFTYRIDREWIEAATLPSQATAVRVRVIG